MAYNEFAYFYDELNGEADYDALYTYIKTELEQQDVGSGIVVDLGCGTGDLTLMLAQAGYDMIGIDQSEEMLAVLHDKAQQLGVLPQLLLLHQNIVHLDLYGTVRGAVSTFDTFNHIGPKSQFEKAIERTALFLEPGGVFVFDMNTPYKHRQVLGDNQFELETPDVRCKWTNRYDPEQQTVSIHLELCDAELGETWQESFFEYTYTLEYVATVLEAHGLRLAHVRDGETFGVLTPQSQRYIITAVKQ